MALDLLMKNKPPTASDFFFDFFSELLCDWLKIVPVKVIIVDKAASSAFYAAVQRTKQKTGIAPPVPHPPSLTSLFLRRLYLSVLSPTPISQKMVQNVQAFAVALVLSTVEGYKAAAPSMATLSDTPTSKSNVLSPYTYYQEVQEVLDWKPEASAQPVIFLPFLVPPPPQRSPLPFSICTISVGALP
jgi:hypothetical protein